jgi:hypothetical protein
VGDAHGRGLGHGPVLREGRLHLRGAQPLAGDVHGVIGAPVEEPEPIRVDRGPVAVHPDAGPPGPVRLQVTVGVAPHAPGHGRPGLGAHELADLTGGYRLSVRAPHVDGHAERGAS